MVEDDECVLVLVLRRISTGRSSIVIRYSRFEKIDVPSRHNSSRKRILPQQAGLEVVQGSKVVTARK